MDSKPIRNEVRTLGELSELVAEWMKHQSPDTPLRPYIGEQPAEFEDGVIWSVGETEGHWIGVFVKPLAADRENQ